MPWARFIVRLAILLGSDPESFLEQGLDRAEDLAWVAAQRVSDSRLGQLGVLMTAMATHMGSEVAYESYVERQIANAWPRRPLQLTDYMILNEIASGRLNTIN